MHSRILIDSESLGERLRKRREALGLSPQDIADEVQAPLKYIMGLESDSYEIFSAKVYATGFLKKIIEVLALENSENFLKEFATEWDIRMYRQKKELTLLPKTTSSKIFITPRRFAFGLSGLLLVIFLSFFGLRLTKFIGTPSLQIREPDDQTVIEHPVTRVRGKTEKESKLTVNGRELTIDELGNFDEEIELSSGLNALEFLSQNRFGKESRETRYIIVK